MRSVLAFSMILASCHPVQPLPYPPGAVIAALPIPKKGASVFKVQSPDQKQTVIVVAPEGYTIDKAGSQLTPPAGLAVRPGERWGFAGDVQRKQYHAVKMDLNSK